MSLQTNVASLNAQRHLGASQGALATSMARLSSGLRVNSAKDDAAGLAIAERMQAQVRGMNVAVRNANDGISLAQTADGALGKVSDALQRMRELAVQARNATNSDSDKASLDKEFVELQKEVSRVLGGTSFNGQAILGADAGTMSFQVGAGVGTDDTIDLALTNLTASSAITAVAGAPAPTSAQVTAAGMDARQAALDYASGIGATTDYNSINQHYTTGATTAAGAAQEAVRATLAYNPSYDGIANGIDQATSAAEAEQIARDNAIAGGMITNMQDAGAEYVAEVARRAYEAFATSLPASPAGASIGSGSTSTDLAQVITDIDAAIDEVNNQRATFGATLSRFESVIGHLQVSVENQSAARGRIMDADFAQETAYLSRAQILQQAGTAMVAQANQLPQGVLSLLN